MKLSSKHIQRIYSDLYEACQVYSARASLTSLILTLCITEDATYTCKVPLVQVKPCALFAEPSAYSDHVLVAQNQDSHLQMNAYRALRISSE